MDNHVIISNPVEQTEQYLPSELIKQPVYTRQW
jgi:hypothetical protein